MKDLNFLKNQTFSHHGIYDNVRIYENTINAFNRSLKYNLPFALDVKITLDNQVVVFHDDNTERLLHVDGEIEKITYDELCYMAKYQIPLLSEVLDIVKGEVPILIQLRSKTRKYKLEIEVAKLFDNYKGKFALQSYNIRTLKWFYKNRPDYVIGYIVGTKNIKSDPFFKKFDFVSLEVNSIKETKIKYYKTKYLLIGWNINTHEDYQKSKHLYDSLVCDNILEITNF